MLAINKKTQQSEADIMTIDANINLAKIVKEKGVQKKWMAKHLQISPSTVSRHLSGNLQLTLKQIEQYSQILEVHPNSIIGVPDIPILGYADKFDQITFRSLNEKEEFLLAPPNFLINAPNLCAIVRKGGADWRSDSYVLFDPYNMLQLKFEDYLFKRYCVLEYVKDGQTFKTIGIPNNNNGKFELTSAVNTALSETGLQISWACLIQATIYSSPTNNWQIK